mmetsp:Transcript_75603/g.221690  ORF Transcript_75603/g.221690 Transcript_75603/m.221690 type:complete len:98 (-) Transcript_75603:71-364(-)
MAPLCSAKQAIAARSQQFPRAPWQMSRLSMVSPNSCIFPDFVKRFARSHVTLAFDLPEDSFAVSPPTFPKDVLSGGNFLSVYSQQQFNVRQQQQQTL